MSLGIPGSGTYKHARELAAAVGIDLSRARVRNLDAVRAGEALMKAEVDMIAMMLPLEAPIVVHKLFVHDIPYMGTRMAARRCACGAAPVSKQAGGPARRR